MKNIVRNYPESERLVWTNGTGSTVAAGEVVIIKGRAWIAHEDILNGESGTVIGRGRFRLPKTTGEGALVQGQPLGWDASAKKTIVNGAPGRFFTVDEAAGTNDTEVVVSLGHTPRVFRKGHTITAGEDTANAADFVHNWGVNPGGFLSVANRAASGVMTTSFTVTYPDTNTVRVAGPLVAGDTLMIEFYEY